jgi:hypothetical protein
VNDDQIERLTRLFRAIADPARLRILGELAAAPRAGHELAERLRLTPPTISHHMAKLVDVGLVRVEPDAQKRHYSLDAAAWRALATPPTSARGSAEPDAADERERVLRAFFDGERLRSIPAQRKKRVVVLQRLLERFEPGRSYPERDVNDMLRVAHDDVATLRRELVDYGFLVRDRGIYRVAHALPERSAHVAQETGPDEAGWFRALIGGATAAALGDRMPSRSPSGRERVAGAASASPGAKTPFKTSAPRSRRPRLKPPG